MLSQSDSEKPDPMPVWGLGMWLGLDKQDIPFPDQSDWFKDGLHLKEVFIMEIIEEEALSHLGHLASRIRPWNCCWPTMSLHMKNKT